MSVLTRIVSKYLKKGAGHQKQDLGLEGERIAARHLKKSGLKILLSRYRCRFGEVDLVARDRDALVFVEVKTRYSSYHGDPSEAVTPEKQKHISRVALDYLRRLQNPEIPVRFDVVEVLMDREPPACKHIRDAFELSEPYIY
jgi:putative endonuclease